MPTRKRSLKVSYTQKATTGGEGNVFFGRLRWGESYTSLILGIVVVVIATILVVSLVRSRREATSPEQDTSSTKTEKTLEEIKESDLPTEYTVVAGDSLWIISEKVYKSGYNWVDIARENNLGNPDAIGVGVKLRLPKVEEKQVKQAQQETNKITGDSYVVKRGDSLWDMSVRAYGDGYRWVEIAKANNLANPDIIHADNILKIPR